jgi:hypothetical protein
MYWAGIVPMVGVGNFVAVLHVLAVAFAVIAAACIVVAIAGMVTGRQGARMGLFVRLLALACFVAAVVLNVADRTR